MDIQKNVSYFKLRLQELLNTSFPEKAYNNKFINQRSQWAFNAYEGALSGGNPQEECEKIADSILFEGLYFSKFDCIFKVVSYEFDTMMADEELRPFALNMLNICEPVFFKYEISDDFLYTTDYDLLYDELSEFISCWIKNDNVENS
ncbi:DUF1896 family protein [Sphingobacterium sp. DR205]|uniref:DUF1896 family protein n=1 Tax=Sphingobacterium sp. DR205 TaxID=2713573 RepID=UPI0013E43FBE|nr:DUF1896 family protein [Sphingobacterium sp. DR205]QIH34472.1 DUF1896 domain-containing protein [Sphingobacterium sp. DR205]